MLLWLALACPPPPAPPAAPDPSTTDDSGSGHGDTDPRDSGAADSGDPSDLPCPAAPHDPAVPLDEADYAAYPVYIAGSDRRFRTIQDGIWGAEEGDVVTVCPGTFHERIDFKGKAITVRSAAGPFVTTLDAQRRGSVVVLRNWEPPEAVLEGFTITGGQGDEFHGGGIFIEYGSPTVRHNVVVDNVARIGGGVYARNGAPTVHNNIIAWNEATEGGGGFTCTACRGSFQYNTVFWNRSPLGPVMEFYWGGADVIGNVMVAEAGATGHAVRLTSVREGVTHTVAYNLLWPDTIDWAPADPPGFPQGEGWVRAAPLLVDVVAGDWTLGPGSPAIDAGPPDALDPDGSRADIGAYGGAYGTW